MLSAAGAHGARRRVEPRRTRSAGALVDDPVTGARLGLPGKLATQTAPGQTGTRWTSAQGQLQIETFRIDTGATLEGAVRAAEGARRAAGSATRCSRPDFFVVSGMQGLKKFYVRGSARNGEVRGITILYDQAMEGTMDPVVVAMSSAFAPFPPGDAAAGADAPRRKVEYGTGVVVSAAGHIVTDRQADRRLQRHRGPELGNAERLADDERRARAAARLWRAQSGSGRSDRRGAARRRRHARRHRRSAGARRRRGDHRGARAARRVERHRGRSSPRRRWASPAPPRSTRRAASPAWWCMKARGGRRTRRRAAGRRSCRSTRSVQFPRGQLCRAGVGSRRRRGRRRLRWCG